MPGITVIGSLNMDLVITTPKIPVLGETVLGSGFMTVHGGKGANQAVASARLGGQVTMIGCVGNDAFGKTIIENLSVNRVNVNYIKAIDSISTGIAVIVVKDGDNFIIVDPGANAKLRPEDIFDCEQVIKESSMVVIQLEIPPGMASAFGVFLFRQSMYTVPGETLDAARIDGAGDFTIYRAIVLPLIRPMLITVYISNFMSVWNDYFWPFIVLKSEEKLTFPVALAGIQGQLFASPWGVIMVGALILTLPAILIYSFLSKYIIPDIFGGSVKG